MLSAKNEFRAARFPSTPGTFASDGPTRKAASKLMEDSTMRTCTGPWWPNLSRPRSEWDLTLAWQRTIYLLMQRSSTAPFRPLVAGGLIGFLKLFLQVVKPQRGLGRSASSSATTASFSFINAPSTDRWSGASAGCSLDCSLVGRLAKGQTENIPPTKISKRRNKQALGVHSRKPRDEW